MLKRSSGVVARSFRSANQKSSVARLFRVQLRGSLGEPAAQKRLEAVSETKSARQFHHRGSPILGLSYLLVLFPACTSESPLMILPKCGGRQKRAAFVGLLFTNLTLNRPGVARGSRAQKENYGAASVAMNTVGL